jgi:Predicted sugar nucleotidyltransferases
VQAIILAAGLGRRLAAAGETALPKCLMEIGGVTLLERHLRLLRAVGVDAVTLVTGYASARIEAALDALAWQPRPTMLHNPGFELGSVLSVHCADALLRSGDAILLMDADVLYDPRILERLCAGPAVDRIPFDTGFEPGDEPVKLCLDGGRIVELRKRVAPGLRHDRVGETVGFFRFTPATAARFADIVAGYVAAGRADQPHEEALRDLFLESPTVFDLLDIAGLPWLEIDFPADVTRARDVVLPRLPPLPK